MAKDFMLKRSITISAIVPGTHEVNAVEWDKLSLTPSVEFVMPVGDKSLFNVGDKYEVTLLFKEKV